MEMLLSGYMASFPLYYYWVCAHEYHSAQACLPRGLGASHLKGQAPQTCICTRHLKKKRSFNILSNPIPYRLKYFIITKMVPTNIVCTLIASYWLTTERADAKICIVWKSVSEGWNIWLAVLINNTTAIPQIFTPQLPNIAEGGWADGELQE